MVPEHYFQHLDLISLAVLFFYWLHTISKCMAPFPQTIHTKRQTLHKNIFFHSNSTHKHQMIIHTHSKLHTDVTNVCFVCSVCSRLVPIDDYIFTFTFMHLADTFIQSDLQLYSGYTFSVVHGIPGNRTHNLLCC